MTLIEESFKLLYPEKEFHYEPKIRYTNHFKDYGANIKLYRGTLEVAMSKKWRSVSKEIRIGLIQELMLKLFKYSKKDCNTMYIDLYHNFVKKIHVSVPKINIDPLLDESFERVNDRYFYGFVEKPNLVWGSNSKRSLGSYDFKTDTIKISNVFKDIVYLDHDILDYIMYHEMLHKKHKFSSKNGRSSFHDSRFREKEKEFDNHKEVDERMKKFLGSSRSFRQDKSNKSPIKNFFFGKWF